MIGNAVVVQILILCKARARLVTQHKAQSRVYNRLPLDDILIIFKRNVNIGEHL